MRYLPSQLVSRISSINSNDDNSWGKGFFRKKQKNNGVYTLPKSANWLFKTSLAAKRREEFDPITSCHPPSSMIFRTSHWNMSELPKVGYCLVSWRISWVDFSFPNQNTQKHWWENKNVKKLRGGFQKHSLIVLIQWLFFLRWIISSVTGGAHLFEIFASRWSVTRSIWVSWRTGSRYNWCTWF